MLEFIIKFFYENDFVKNLPEVNVSIVKPTKQIYRLGGAANVANNINSLSKKYLLLSRIGRGSGDKYFKEIYGDKLKFNEKNYTVGIKHDITLTLNKL